MLICLGSVRIGTWIWTPELLKNSRIVAWSLTAGFLTIYAYWSVDFEC